MAVGKGKYDDLCTEVRERAGAQGACVIIAHGTDGSGFSVQMPAAFLPILVSQLREAADQIEASIPKSH